MKKLILFVIAFTCITNTQAQFLKNIKNKVSKTINNGINKAVGNDKSDTELENKENEASDSYSDVTENREKPVFVEQAPDNGKMVVQLKKGDLFWGGYLSLKGQPLKGDTAANILDFINARVGTYYDLGEIDHHVIYFDGKRIENDSSKIPLRPDFFSYDTKDSTYILTTRSVIPLTPADYMNGVRPKLPTFSFKINNKTYGPFNGVGEKVMISKSMTDGKPLDKFYALGTELVETKDEKGREGSKFVGLVQTEKNIIRINDCATMSMAPTYPEGTMVFANGTNLNSFSNGKTVPVIKIPELNGSMFTGGKYFSEVFGTDNGNVVGIVAERKTVLTEKETDLINTRQAYINYKYKLNFPINITRTNLLISVVNPGKSMVYNNHKLYYADGSKETIYNVGDAQMLYFNGKDYIVWFEMMKNSGGHQIYVCQKELK